MASSLETEGAVWAGVLCCIQRTRLGARPTVRVITTRQVGEVLTSRYITTDESEASASSPAGPRSGTALGDINK